jgi:hypothetical protein
MPEYEGKYLFVSNVRTEEGLASQMLGYDTLKEAEIKYHQEVAYGLQLDTIELAHYFVMNEYGVIMGNLETTIDNIPPVEESEEVEE